MKTFESGGDESVSMLTDAAGPAAISTTPTYGSVHGDGARVLRAIRASSGRCHDLVKLEECHEVLKCSNPQVPSGGSGERANRRSNTL